MVRPIYDKTVTVLGRQGLERNINGTDRILISPESRGLGEAYEEACWKSLMKEVREGDTVLDIGAFIGLYTIAFASRVGPTGRVIAFEPDPDNYRLLLEHLRLNGVAERVEAIHAAAGETVTIVQLSRDGSQTHVSTQGQDATVECKTVDSVIRDAKIDVVKMDVEGYEEHVVRGATKLLSDPQRKPRLMYIEVHPYAWPNHGTSDRSLLSLLRSFGYAAEDLNGESVERIDRYGEVVCRLSEGREHS
ncbi:MAG TPA: FkbM family methyltransferase [Acidobacteriota bacterium]|nr:FkbM family methyltransferase [Acidobacteriota bacterium]